ncbi:MAG: ArsR/SmtB family transcription factor [Nitrososphaerales archaeon]
MWLKFGFDQDVFRLFIKMRGAPTRLKVLRSLIESPKDRAQIAEQLGLDWKAIDRHIELLERFGVIKEKSRLGTTKFYELTPSGNLLLKLVEEMDKEQ